MKENDLGRRRMMLAGIAGIAADLAPLSGSAQDAARVQPGAYRVVLDNAQLRVLEFSARPGTELCGVGRHSHPAHLTIALSDAKVRVTLPDGKQIIAENKLGDVMWSEAETHTTENIGGRAVRALIVEIKGAAGKG